MTPVRSIARRLGLGRLTYLLWHVPIEVVRESKAAGGPFEQVTDLRGRRAMEWAAETLPTSRAAPAEYSPALHFLTGNKYWFQTAFCLHSLQHHAGVTFRVVFHDDGSLSRTSQERLCALFPSSQICLRADNDQRIAALLPRTKFPFLHERRERYPHILKLTDVHAGRSGWQLVLDSDMLIFRRPEFLLSWLSSPDRPLHLLDIADAYGYSRPLMESLAGVPIPPRVNVGLTGLRSEKLNWEQIEFWCRRLIESEGTHYYLEQALVAMIVAQQPSAVAPEYDYVVAPTRAQCDPPKAVLHHYVADTKRWYFRQTWRDCIAGAAGNPATASQTVG